MSRFRPSSPPGSPYITRAGYERLNAELQHLWKVRRPEVTRAVSEAAALGDRSENAEYIYGKKMLREIDRRVRFLAKRLDVLQVVDRVPEDTARVYFGAWVELEDEAGALTELRIVGPDELEPQQQWISVDSPMARALLKKQEGDEVRVALPQGEARYWIVGIRYAQD